MNALDRPEYDPEFERAMNALRADLDGRGSVPPWRPVDVLAVAILTVGVLATSVVVVSAFLVALECLHWLVTLD